MIMHTDDSTVSCLLPSESKSQTPAVPPPPLPPAYNDAVGVGGRPLPTQAPTQMVPPSQQILEIKKMWDDLTTPPAEFISRVMNNTPITPSTVISTPQSSMYVNNSLQDSIGSVYDPCLVLRSSSTNNTNNAALVASGAMNTNMIPNNNNNTKPQERLMAQALPSPVTLEQMNERMSSNTLNRVQHTIPSRKAATITPSIACLHHNRKLLSAADGKGAEGTTTTSHRHDPKLYAPPERVRVNNKWRVVSGRRVCSHCNELIPKGITFAEHNQICKGGPPTCFHCGQLIPFGVSMQESGHGKFCPFAPVNIAKWKQLQLLPAPPSPQPQLNRPLPLLQQKWPLENTSVSVGENNSSCGTDLPL